jgi:hypothetical protein
MKIVKAGVLGGKTLEASKPNVELFAPERPGWISKLEGAEQKDAMWGIDVDEDILEELWCSRIGLSWMMAV